MIWDKGQWNMDLYRLYKRLVHLRTTSTVLANGSYTLIVKSKDSVRYERFLKAK